MVASRLKLQVIGLLGALLLMAAGDACDGFFVDPTLQAISVSTLQSSTLASVGSTLQLVASGSYDDGSAKNLTGHVTWSATPPGFVTLSTTTPGLVTATMVTSPGTAVTVQAAELSSNGLVVTGSITIMAGTSAALTLTSSPASPISISGSGGTGATVQFGATFNGTSVTSSTVFTSSNSSIINIASGSTSGTLGGTTGAVTITGTYAAGGASGTLQIVVKQ